jgi:hypothetical protein
MGTVPGLPPVPRAAISEIGSPSVVTTHRRLPAFEGRDVEASGPDAHGLPQALVLGRWVVRLTDTLVEASFPGPFSLLGR